MVGAGVAFPTYRAWLCSHTPHPGRAGGSFAKVPEGPFLMYQPGAHITHCHRREKHCATSTAP